MERSDEPEEGPSGDETTATDGGDEETRRSPDSDASHGRDRDRQTVDDASPTGEETTSDEDRAPPPPERFAHEATDLAEFWTEYPLDFDPESLRHLDSLVAEHWPAGPDDDTAEGVRRGMVVQFGSYFGETLVRNRDAEWTELGPGTWAVVVRGQEGEATVDPFRVARDCLDGSGRFRSLYETVVDEI